MILKELCEQIDIELEMMDKTVFELTSLYADVSDRTPSVREITAAGAFIAQFYGGIENILKRIHVFNSYSLPTGVSWHIDLFKRYCSPPFKKLPVLFDEQLAASLAPFRKFRHVVYHSYGHQLDWSRVKEGIEIVESVYLHFKSNISEYLKTLKAH